MKTWSAQGTYRTQTNGCLVKATLRRPSVIKNHSFINHKRWNIMRSTDNPISKLRFYKEKFKLDPYLDRPFLLRIYIFNFLYIEYMFRNLSGLTKT